MAISLAVLSRGAEDGGTFAFEDALADDLSSRGFRVLVVPHLYHLRAGDAAASRLAAEAAGGEVSLVSWLHPRAAEWTLRFLLAESGSEGARDAEGVLGVRAFSMTGACCPSKCADAIEAGAGSPGGKGSVEEIECPVETRWHPILDYSLCVQCGRCRDFCLFGVYEESGGAIVAAHPERCKPGCPACARVCPEGAIMFPLYDGDEAIAGAAGAKVKGGPIDVKAFLERSQRDREPCPVCGCACDCERSSDGTAPPGKIVCPACGCICDPESSCDCRGGVPAGEAVAARNSSCCESGDSSCCGSGGNDEIDDLIDALDNLDV